MNMHVAVAKAQAPSRRLRRDQWRWPDGPLVKLPDLTRYGTYPSPFGTLERRARIVRAVLLLTMATGRRLQPVCRALASIAFEGCTSHSWLEYLVATYESDEARACRTAHYRLKKMMLSPFVPLEGKVVTIPADNISLAEKERRMAIILSRLN
jgi:hypothetical protein